MNARKLLEKIWEASFGPSNNKLISLLKSKIDPDGPGSWDNAIRGIAIIWKSNPSLVKKAFKEVIEHPDVFGKK